MSKKSKGRRNDEAEETTMGIAYESCDDVVHEFAKRIGTVRWRPAFGIDGISWYYAEDRLYVVKDSRWPIPRYGFVEARNPQEACEAFEARFNECPF